MQHFFSSDVRSTKRFGMRATASFVLAAAVLAGCASTSEPRVAARSFESLMSEADAELAKGQREKSVDILEQAAREQPTNMLPWLKIANIWFEAGNYPASILAANEALQRDAGNAEAKSLLVVSGLRVAAGAVNGLRPNSRIAPNARNEAENLTKAMRAQLGEEVLVPTAGEEKPGRAKPRQRPARPTADGTASAPAATLRNTAAQTVRESAGNAASNAASNAAANASQRASDPFKSLK